MIQKRFKKMLKKVALGISLSKDSNRRFKTVLYSHARASFIHLSNFLSFPQPNYNTCKEPKLVKVSLLLWHVTDALGTLRQHRREILVRSVSTLSKHNS